jgi:hypothetical protein
MKRRTLRAAAAAIVLLATTGGVAATGAAAADFEIHVKSNGEIARIGALRRPARATLSAAKRAFGTTRQVYRSGKNCPARWADLSLQILFVRVSSNGNPCKRTGRAQAAFFADRRWSTARGLHPGDRFRRLHRLYPHARRHGNEWWLIWHPARPGHVPVVPLSVAVREGRVDELHVWIGGAGGPDG